MQTPVSPVTEEENVPSFQSPCQAIFRRWYPDFRDAGQRYADLVSQAVRPDTLLLDLGCGRMSLAEGAIRQGRLSVGIDLDHEDLRSNISLSHVVLAQGEALPFPAGCFDLVLSQWTFEHLAHPACVMSECARVLRPGGRLVIFTTNAWNYIPVAGRLLPGAVQQKLAGRLLNRPAHETHPTYYRANTHRQLAALGCTAGLELTQYSYVGNPFYLAFSPFLFRLALAFERATDWLPLQRFKLYLLASLMKPDTLSA